MATFFKEIGNYTVCIFCSSPRIFWGVVWPLWNKTWGL